MRSFELLWGSRDRPRRGPKPKMSIEKIVRAAIGLADTEGLGALSMQRIAAELGFTTMSLYRYVPSKEQLIDVMADAAIGEPPAMDDATDTDWRAGIELWAHRLWAGYRRHPWLLRAEMSGPPIGPNQLGWLEAALYALSGTGLSADEMLRTAWFLDGAIRDMARVTLDAEGVQQRAGLSAEKTGADYSRAMAEIVDGQRFPTLHRVVGAGVFAPGATPHAELGPEPDYRFGLQRTLDGIESYVQRRAGGRDVG